MKLQQYDRIKPRTTSQRADDVTAFGFPTIQFQDESKNKVTRNLAGCPGFNRKNILGEPLIHNKIIENEKMIGRDNVLQKSYQSYVYDTKTKTNRINNKKDEDDGQPVK